MTTNQKRYYAGIGSREVPSDIAFQMARVASYLEDVGFTLRSGNAEGSDQAFASGVNTAAQIWLPWETFQANFKLEKPYHDYRVISQNDTDAYKSVIDYHPTPNKLGVASCKFMARNFRQAVGKDEPNSEFIICWTPGGKAVGGTGQCLRIAKSLGIPIFNMFEFNTFESIKNHLKVWYGI